MEETNKKLNVFTEIVGRAMLQQKLDRQHYAGDRNLHQALGYKTDLDYEDYLARYLRQDIAKAVIDRPAKVTWQGNMAVIETNDDTETDLEKAWRELDEKLKLKTRFHRADKLAGLGCYSVLFLGANDVRNREGLKTQLKKGSELMYVKPLGEGSAAIQTYENRTSNPRYGLPLTYNIILSDSENGSKHTIPVHHSRIVHIVDDILESEIKGMPRLESVFNRLMDLEKIVGGDAEMFWRGARPGYAGTVRDDYQMTPEVKEDLLNQIDEYEHDLRRFLVNQGVDLEALAQQIADPLNHVDVQIQMISAVTGIPKRILTGSERGELSSAQDSWEWLAFVKARREEYAEPRIVRPFIDRCIEYGILPAPADTYTLKWEDLFSLSEKDRADIGAKRAAALREYSTNPMAEYIVTPTAFLRKFLGLSEDEVEMITSLRETEEKIEMPVTEEETAIIEQEPVNVN